MREIVTRILSYRPHIVLVEGSLTYICQLDLQVCFNIIENYLCISGHTMKGFVVVSRMFLDTTTKIW